ncbi:MAG: helix-turn-helix domain-containing protein [Acidobacteria bacterium]|nr:helix-turn-helix domain-containing protein [Acidobacteriota bacterium]
MWSEDFREQRLRSTLRDLRESMGLSRTELAARLGLGCPTVEEYELRRFAADVPTLWKLGQLARSGARPDLAARFEGEAVRPFEQGTGGLPTLVAGALDLLRDEILASGDPQAEALACVRYVHWRRHADPEDAARLERKLKDLSGLERVDVAPPDRGR